MSFDDSQIERFELKYLLGDERAQAIRAIIRPYCALDAYGPQGSYEVSTLYLDSPSLALHRARLRDDPDRFKLRIRGYPGSPTVKAEIKRKVKDTIHKRRATIAAATMREAANGLAGALVEAESANLARFALLVAQLGAEPTILVHYQREAWVSQVDGYARVTLDRQLQYQPTAEWTLDGDPRAWVPLDGSWHLDGLRSPFVLELKCEHRVPFWIRHVIQTQRLRQTGFSKYSHSQLTEERVARGLETHPYV